MNSKPGRVAGDSTNGKPGILRNSKSDAGAAVITRSTRAEFDPPLNHVARFNLPKPRARALLIKI
jgi:hypothetical protein